MGKQDARPPLHRLRAGVDWVFGHLGWLPAVANGAFTIAGAVLLGTIGDLHDGPAVTRMVLGIIAMVLSLAILLALDWWRRASDQAAGYETAQANVALSQAIVPTVQRIALMPRQPSDARKRERDRVVAHACSSILIVLRGVQGVRAVVYRVNDAGSALEPMDSYGRKDRPRKFVKGDGGAGDDVFDLIANREPELIKDTATDERTKRQPQSKHYRTFVRAPIRANGLAYGMMTVDAPNVGDLSDADKQIVEVLADLLAIAAGLVEK